MNLVGTNFLNKNIWSPFDKRRVPKIKLQTKIKMIVWTYSYRPKCFCCPCLLGAAETILIWLGQKKNSLSSHLIREKVPKKTKQ